jgi:hypothetical protein
MVIIKAEPTVTDPLVDDPSAKVDHVTDPVPPAYAPPEIDMATAIPPEHRNKEYFKDITFEKMTNEFVALQTKLGERPTVGVPGADAKTEDVEAFYNSLRPKEKGDYKFPETEYSKANGVNEEFQTSMRDVFHKAGVSQHQVNLLTAGYDGVLAALKAKEAVADQEFDDKITDTFGKDGREAALNISKNLMKENIPEDMKPLLDKLPNSALLLLATTLNAVHKKYIAEDTLNGDPSPATGDPKALRAEAMLIYQSKEFRNAFDPGHEDAVKKYQELRDRIALLHKS